MVVTPRGFLGDVNDFVRNPYGTTHFTRADGSRPVDESGAVAAQTGLFVAV
jgi:hypothetical protein